MQMTEATKRPARARRSLAYLIIPATAFVGGIIGTVVVARAKSDPFVGVYRQEVVAVVADTSGRIVSLERRHGEEVQPGDPLMTLTNGCSAAEFQNLKAERERLRRELENAEAKAAVELALKSNELEKERLETQLRYADLLRTRLDVQLRRKALESGEGRPSSIAMSTPGVTLASVESPGALRRLELADVANHEEVLNTQIALCEDRLAELERLKGALAATIERSFRVEAIASDLATASSECETLARAEETCQIVSPAYGRVGVCRRKVGDHASTGETLVEIFDAERPYVLVTVPIVELNEFTAGRRVRVSFEGIQTRKPLEGEVAEVISDAERDAEIAAGPGAAAARVRITPVGRIWPTPPAGATAFVQLLP